MLVRMFDDISEKAKLGLYIYLVLKYVTGTDFWKTLSALNSLPRNPEF